MRGTAENGWMIERLILVMLSKKHIKQGELVVLQYPEFRRHSKTENFDFKCHSPTYALLSARGENSQGPLPFLQIAQ